MPQSQSVLAKIIDYVVATLQPQRIILFGSRARGDAEARSDYDIAIEVPEIDEREWTRFIVDAENNIDTLSKVDIIRLDTADPKLRKHIETEGKTIYARRQTHQTAH